MSVNDKMTAIADGIRALLGTTAKMGVDAMAANLGTEKSNVMNAYNAVSNKGGTVPSSKTSGNLASAIQSIPTGSGGSTTPTVEQATPTISVSSTGLITASATQTAGYVSAGTKSTTKQLTVQAAQTITPGTSNKTISSGRYLTGTQTIKGDANLVAGNIKSGVSIFGVSGTYAASGGTAQPVLQEKTVTPSASGSTVIPDSGYDGLSAVYVRGDADLIASNIKSGVQIFGVTGTYEGDSTGGNLPTGISALASGVLTPEVDIAEAFVIQHGLGVEPNFLTFILMDTLTEAVPGLAISGVAYKKDGLPTASSLLTVEYYGLTGTTASRRSGTFLSTESFAYITPLASDTVMKAGYSYRWVCGVMDGIG